MAYRLLREFEGLFNGTVYKHRVSTNGDRVAIRFFEDLVDLNRSRAYADRVGSGLCVVSIKNSRQGIKLRRGDGCLGEIVPNVGAVYRSGYSMARGPIATIEIGIEVKILAKAMIKQIDRVINDLNKQANVFRAHGGKAITVGIVGINHAPEYVSWEGDRSFATDGHENPHPAQEASKAEARLMAEFGDLRVFDEFLILHFSATNMPPFNFSWVNKSRTEHDYGAALARVSSKYQDRF